MRAIARSVKGLLLLAATCALMACANQPRTFTMPPFKATDFAGTPEKGSGSATVSGQLFMTTRGGDVKKGAGRGVLLLPDVPVSSTIVTEIASGAAPTQIDSKYRDYFYTSTADADGKFHFDNVPDGSYIAFGAVFWFVPGLPQQGGYIWKNVEVSHGKSIEVMLTR